MTQFLITAEDHWWFGRCRRSWDLGAHARHNLEPATRLEDPMQRTRRVVREALAVYYFPGMWSWNRAIVEPLVAAAVERGGGEAPERALLEAYALWAPLMDRDLTPVRIESDVDVPVPDPDREGEDLATPTGGAVRYRDRVPLVVAESHRGDQEVFWLVEHRVVDRWAEDDELALDERGVLACWAWEHCELALPVRGTVYNEMRSDLSDFRRTRVERTSPEKASAMLRLGRTARDMLGTPTPADPTPEWSHCSACAFRAPCIAMNRGDPADRLLTVGYRPRPPDMLEEGRLGGTSWGMGRGAAPPRFDG